MKQFALVGIFVGLVAVGLMGCDWNTGSDAESWSSSFDWVNFSGTYRGSATRFLVTDYSTLPSSTGDRVTKPGTASGSGVTQDTAGGTLNKTEIVPGSVSVTIKNSAGGPHSYWSDPQKNSVLTGGEGTGFVTYTDGSWGINFANNVGPDNGTWSAAFQYYVIDSGTNTGGAASGATGKEIYAFSIFQRGQNLTITDNNGATYTGYISQIRSTSGFENEDETGKEQPVDGDTVVASFECSGVSAAGRNVKIVGTLQGTVAAGMFTGRTLTGTWIETPGKTGDISGTTTSIEITLPTAEPAPADTNTAAMAISP